MQQISDPYRALGVPRGATEAEIKAAHRRLAKRYHPDAAEADTKRFLSVQEAYRVLSDPLLRREWDARHAPGPVNATERAARRPRAASRSQRRSKSTAAAADNAAARDEPARSAQDGPARPRSKRAYTWSASEVPWWEEGAGAHGERRARRGGRAAADRTEPAEASSEADAPNEFDVYNRSSGAAWSMAARAYFRRGDQDLPRGGSFRHEGTQPLTAARARAAAEAEARRRAAASSAQAATPPNAGREAEPRSSSPPPNAPRTPRAPAYAYASAGVARDAKHVATARERYLRATRGGSSPAIVQRMLYALLAWLPIAALLAVAARPAMEPELAAIIAATLVCFVLLPKLAYVAGTGTVGLLIAAGLTAGALVVLGLRPPLPNAVLAILGASLTVGYFIGGLAALASARDGWPWEARRTP